MEQIKVLSEEKNKENINKHIPLPQLSPLEKKLAHGSFYFPVFYSLGFLNCAIYAHRLGYSNCSRVFFAALVSLVPLSYYISSLGFGVKELREIEKVDEDNMKSAAYFENYNRN